VRRVAFPGPLFGGDKDAAYFNADLFILPTHSENFGMVVAEALAHGCPAIVTHGAPWSGLKTKDCGWWVEGGADKLTSTLDGAMQKSQGELSEMGRKGRAWMQCDFGWPSVAQKMNAAYHWLLDGGVRPGWVRED
jgi:glycosyltransferase involved in cell wall biosynthesis